MQLFSALVEVAFFTNQKMVALIDEDDDHEYGEIDENIDFSLKKNWFCMKNNDFQ